MPKTQLTGSQKCKSQRRNGQSCPSGRTLQKGAERDVRFSEDQLTLSISVKRSSKIGARKMVTRLSNMKTGLISAGATQGRGWRMEGD